MQNWKENRFIVVSDELGLTEYLIILTDVSFWNHHYEELKDWCDENNCTQQGMTVASNSEQSITAFCLRWS